MTGKTFPTLLDFPEAFRFTVVPMTENPERNLTVKWIWLWIGRERRRRRIGMAAFAERLQIGRQSLREYESGEVNSPSAVLIDALESLDALGAVAEIDELNWHGVAVSLSKNETREYDAIAEDPGVSRAQVVRQLAAEGLVARAAADRASGKSGPE